MELEEVLAQNPHLGEYLQQFAANPPSYHEKLHRDGVDLDAPNVLYRAREPIFVHVWDDASKVRHYVAIEPAMDAAEREKYGLIRERVLRMGPYEGTPRTQDELREVLRKLYDRATRVENDPAGGPRGRFPRPFVRNVLATLDHRVSVTEHEKRKLLYFLERDIVDAGPLEPLIRDPYIEDISCIGTTNIFIVHKFFGPVETNVRFRDDRELDEFCRNMGERIGRPVSESKPIVDATLPDGSRINMIYSDDVSQRGPSFTIRKVSDTPISITQICKYGTMSTDVAAYLWICLQNGQSVFVCGETASGKTTSLNGILSFIKPKEKVFTAEDTPEVKPPQPLWQQLVTRSSGPPEARVELFDLLRAALRSRPNYIIVGEIRGGEGAVAFQAMQTGHPVIATFHASSVGKMIQRFTSDPINVPVTFMDNLNVCMIQMAVYNRGKMLRRVLAVEEIEGYSEAANGVITRRVFDWDPNHDSHGFRGRNNSFVLEQKIAPKAGYSDKRKIYEDLEYRKQLLDDLIRRKVYDYHEVNRIIARFNDDWPDNLPFKV